MAPHVVEKLLNHTTGALGGIAGVYNRFGYLDEMREALERWEHELMEHVLSRVPTSVINGSHASSE